MNISEALGDPELERILWACLNYWSSEQIPLDQRTLCYSWVVSYENKFGLVFHQSRLQHLVHLGFLTKDDTSRGGARRYYRLADPSHLAELLSSCDLN